MDDKEVESTRDQSNTTDQPFVVKRPERTVPDAFNANSEEIAKTDVEPASTPVIPPVKKKKGLIISLIAATLVLLGLGLAYVYWYQNPNKVVSDAIMHAISAKTMTYTGAVTAAGPTKMVVTLNGDAASKGGTVNAKFAFDVDGQKYTLDGNAIVDEKNDLYFKVQNIDGLVNNYRRAIPANSLMLFDQIIDRIDDKWIRVSAADLRSYDVDLAAMQKCTTDAAKKLQSDNTVKSELTEAYKKHPFIAIDKNLGAKDGSLGYALSANRDQAKSFINDYKNSSLYKSLVECDDNFAIKDDELLKQAEEKTNDKTSVDLWVDRWSHQITKVDIKNESDKNQTMNVTLEPKFNRPVTITTPKDATTLEQLQKDVMQLLQSARSAPATTPAAE